MKPEITTLENGIEIHRGNDPIEDLEGIKIQGGTAEALAHRLRHAHTAAEYCAALLDLHAHLCAVQDSEGSQKLRARIVRRMVEGWLAEKAA